MDERSRPTRRVTVKPVMPQVYRLLKPGGEGLAARWPGPLPGCYRLEEERFLLLERPPSPAEKRLLSEYCQWVGNGRRWAARLEEYGERITAPGSAPPASGAPPR